MDFGFIYSVNLYRIVLYSSLDVLVCMCCCNIDPGSIECLAI